MINTKHVDVYREPGRYAGWPANYGIWAWENEIVVGFTSGYMNLTTPGMHAIDRNREHETMFGRSLDGGETWSTESARMGSSGGGISADEHLAQELRSGDIVESLAEPPGNIEFLHPDFAMICARSGLGEGARSWFYISYDRCRTWAGPYGLPNFGTRGVAARTDYQVLGDRECVLFLTGKVHDGEGMPFCVATTDAGKSFQFRSFIGSQTDGFSIMPASVILPGGDFLVAVRRRSDAPPTECGENWIEAFRSRDRCATWNNAGVAVPDTGSGGNPPTLTLCEDGTLCLTYGYRAEPFGMRARISKDAGTSWEQEIVLRDDGGCKDIGYPRTVQRPDGSLVTTYYYTDSPESERYIAATVWRV